MCGSAANRRPTRWSGARREERADPEPSTQRTPREGVRLARKARVSMGRLWAGSDGGLIQAHDPALKAGMELEAFLQLQSGLTVDGAKGFLCAAAHMAPLAADPWFGHFYACRGPCTRDDE